MREHGDGGGRVIMAKSISVIIVSYHTGPSLIDGLNALIADIDASEIILVDNGNPKEMREHIASINSPKLRILQGHGNIGFGAGCNYGAQICGGDFIAFINPDASPSQGALAAMKDVIKSAPTPSIAGGLLLDETGVEQRGSRRGEITLLKYFGALIGIDKFNLHKTPLPAAPHEVGTVSGAAMMMTRASFDALGGFDERYFLHVEDIDICKRARKMGGHIISVPEAKIVHIGATSQTSSLFVSAHKTSGFVRYFWTHSGVFGKIGTVMAAPIIMVATMLHGLLR